jgi:hypothetical protein
MRFSSTIAPWPLAILLAMVVLRVPAQTGGDSPYSAYGLGNLVGNPQVSQLLMGGVSVAYIDQASISQTNPASYVGLRKTAFEIGILGSTVKLTDSKETQKRNSNQLLGFSLAVPWNNSRWALAIGLMPVSTVGYLISDQETLSTGSTVNLTYRGTGGLNQGFVGLAHTVWQAKPDSSGSIRGRLSLGANIDYLFGTIEQTRRAQYPPGQGYTNFSVYSGLVLRGATANFGLHFSNELISMRTMERKRVERELARKAKHQAWMEAHPGEQRTAPPSLRPASLPWRYVIGLCAELPTGLRAKRNLLESTFVTIGGIDITRDTVLITKGQRGSFAIPPAFGVGFSVMNERWTVAADVKRRDWADLRLNVDGYSLNAGLEASMSYSIGASFRPAYERDRNFLKRVIYRAGYRYTSDYLRVEDIQLDESAWTAGISLPISEGNYLSRLNFGVLLGKRGDPGDGALEERVTNFYLGLTLTPNLRERWFAPYRID